MKTRLAGDGSRCDARRRRHAAAAVLAVAVAALRPDASITVEGVADKGVYADSMSFLMRKEPNADYTATWNERDVPVDTLTPVDEPDDYEFLV